MNDRPCPMWPVPRRRLVLAWAIWASIPLALVVGASLALVWWAGPVLAVGFVIAFMGEQQLRKLDERPPRRPQRQN